MVCFKTGKGSKRGRDKSYGIYKGPAKSLSLGSDYFSATFYQTYFYYKPSNYSPLYRHTFCNLFTRREKQINSLLLESVGGTDK